MNVLSICKHEPSRNVQMGDKPTKSLERYSVAMDDLYPFMLSHIASGVTIKEEHDCKEYTRLLAHFRSRFQQGIDDAAQPLSNFLNTSMAERRKNRAEVLEFLRKWFTAELKDAVTELKLSDLREDTANSHSLGESDSPDPTPELIAAVRDSVCLNLHITARYESCQNCGGVGHHVVGDTSPKEIPCDTCEGKGSTRIDPFWKL